MGMNLLYVYLLSHIKQISKKSSDAAKSQSIEELNKFNFFLLQIVFTIFKFVWNENAVNMMLTYLKKNHEKRLAHLEVIPEDDIDEDINIDKQNESNQDDIQREVSDNTTSDSSAAASTINNASGGSKGSLRFNESKRISGLRKNHHSNTNFLSLHEDHKEVKFQVIVAIFNLVIAPLIASALISTQCFYYAGPFSVSPYLKIDYSYSACDDYAVSPTKGYSCINRDEKVQSIIIPMSNEYSFQVSIFF